MRNVAIESIKKSALGKLLSMEEQQHTSRTMQARLRKLLASRSKPMSCIAVRLKRRVYSTHVIIVTDC